MRYIENFELREWVKDSLRKTIFQKAHALSIQTGCEILIKLKDDNDELTGHQCYATGSLQKAYLNNVIHKDPDEFFVSGETGQPLMDRGIQSDDTSRSLSNSRSSSVDTSPESLQEVEQETSTGSIQPHPATAVSDATSQFNTIQTPSRNLSSQPTEFHSSIETVDYGPEFAKDSPMEDDPAADDEEDDMTTQIKVEPSEDLDHIPPLPSSHDKSLDDDLKREPGNDSGSDEEDYELEATSPVSLSQDSVPPESQHGSHHHQGVSSARSSSAKPYQCGVCSKSFQSIQVLQKHSQTVHRHREQSKSRGFKLKQSRTKVGSSTMWKQHKSHVSAANQHAIPHACSMCNQRFAESILLNDHIVKVHLNMDAINPSSSGPFTQTQPPDPSQYGAILQGELPQIASVSSIGQYPPNPIPSTASSSFSQSPMGPGPSTSTASGSAQGSNFTSNLEYEDYFGISHDEGAKKRSKVYFTPRIMNMPGLGKYLLGGHPGLQRDITSYRTLLEKVAYYRRTSDADNGRLLCMRLFREEFTMSELAIKNVTGVSRACINEGQDNYSIISVPKLDTEVLNAIFMQAKHQFPGFTDSLTDISCKTVKRMNDICKKARNTMYPTRDERSMLAKLSSPTCPNQP